MVATLEKIGGGRAGAGLVLRVDLVEGDFAAPCELCGVRPTAAVVRVWEEDPEALQPAGAAGPVERHPFCARHRGAAGALYQMLAR
jgi:hypothetical protein